MSAPNIDRFYRETTIVYLIESIKFYGDRTWSPSALEIVKESIDLIELIYT